MGESEPVIVSGIAFGDVAERISRLSKGDALAVTGALKPTIWNDKATGEERHGLNITVSACLSPYDVKKRRSAREVTDEPSTRPHATPWPRQASSLGDPAGDMSRVYAVDDFDDDLSF